MNEKVSQERLINLIKNNDEETFIDYSDCVKELEIPSNKVSNCKQIYIDNNPRRESYPRSERFH